jgi:type I restriction enzyme R subunit
VRGFNAILATQSIPFAKAYYAKIRELQKKLGTDYRVALIYSWAANPETEDFTADEEMDASGLSKSDREFLDSAIADYNRAFGTSFSTQGKGGKSGEGFDNYYKDLSMRMKSREVDLLIVVNMFLTGFDAKCLNTLFVDKRLKQHGLIQAFSRTNRILNSVKSFGNVICFRNLEQEVDDALALFGDKDASGIVVLKPYAEWMADYQNAVDELHAMLAAGELPLGEAAEKAFIRAWGLILRLRNILSAFDEFQGNDLLGTREVQDYQSVYNTLWEKYRKQKKAQLESIVDDIEFEMELVKQVEVGIDYILMLVAKYHASNCEDKEIRADIDRAIAAAPTLRDKKELIDKFIDVTLLSVTLLKFLAHNLLGYCYG